MDFTIEPLAEDSLLLRFGDSIDVETNARVHAAATALREAALQGVTDIAPAYASLLVRFDPAMRDTADAVSALTGQLHEIIGGYPQSIGARSPHPGFRRNDEQETGSHAIADGAIVEIPVCYGGDFGPDLDAVAAHAGLARNAVIDRHAAASYTVAMLGFAPGFPYLLGLDPALHMPRRAHPRTRVPAGSVAIGGAQTGIYPRELPGGWNLIGCTPLILFDARREPPALLGPGDRVRFRAIDANEFVHLAERQG